MKKIERQGLVALPTDGGQALPKDGEQALPTDGGHSQRMAGKRVETAKETGKRTTGDGENAQARMPVPLLTGSRVVIKDPDR
jgi:hypothetical protein